jgi:hypothetical protein
MTVSYVKASAHILEPHLHQVQQCTEIRVLKASSKRVTGYDGVSYKLACQAADPRSRNICLQSRTGRTELIKVMNRSTM